MWIEGAGVMITVLMPKGEPIPADELQTIVDTFTDCRKRGMPKMEAYRRVGLLVGRDAKVIGVTIARLNPTTDLAKMYVRAKALKMMKRVVKKGTTAELIDVLGRPSIGVLDSPSKEGAGSTGFFISVDAGTCGAVKVGAIHTPDQPALTSGDFDPFKDLAADIIDIERVETHANGDEGDQDRPVSRAEAAVRAVKERLRAASANNGDV